MFYHFCLRTRYSIICRNKAFHGDILSTVHASCGFLNGTLLTLRMWSAITIPNLGLLIWLCPAPFHRLVLSILISRIFHQTLFVTNHLLTYATAKNLLTIWSVLFAPVQNGKRPC